MGTFLGKIQHCWKLVLSPLQMGQNYYLARSTGHKCWIWKINENAWCILKIRAFFPKVHWWISEDSGRFLARIPKRGLGLDLFQMQNNLFYKLSPLKHNCKVYQTMYRNSCTEIGSNLELIDFGYRTCWWGLWPWSDLPTKNLLTFDITPQPRTELLSPMSSFTTPAEKVAKTWTGKLANYNSLTSLSVRNQELHYFHNGHFHAMFIILPENCIWDKH